MRRARSLADIGCRHSDLDGAPAARKNHQGVIYVPLFEPSEDCLDISPYSTRPSIAKAADALNRPATEPRSAASTDRFFGFYHCLQTT